MNDEEGGTIGAVSTLLTIKRDVGPVNIERVRRVPSQTSKLLVSQSRSGSDAFVGGFHGLPMLLASVKSFDQKNHEKQK